MDFESTNKEKNRKVNPVEILIVLGKHPNYEFMPTGIYADGYSQAHLLACELFPTGSALTKEYVNQVIKSYLVKDGNIESE